MSWKDRTVRSEPKTQNLALHLRFYSSRQLIQWKLLQKVRYPVLIYSCLSNYRLLQIAQKSYTFLIATTGDPVCLWITCQTPHLPLSIVSKLFICLGQGFKMFHSFIHPILPSQHIFSPEQESPRRRPPLISAVGRFVQKRVFLFGQQTQKGRRLYSL